jgi:DNA-packaging protein gp3
MAAPANNQFWKLRSKHGRDKLFADPKELWDAACEYFQWCEDNPFTESKPMVVSNGNNEGSSIQMAVIPIKRPFTLEGLCLYLNASSSYFRAFKSDERAKKEDYLTVINAIEETIANQQFSGAAAGFFNANIIARKLGLKEQTDITTQGEKIAPVVTAMVDGQIIDGEMK